MKNWEFKNAFKNDNIQFNTLFKSVMAGTQTFDNIDSGNIISDIELNTILKSLNRQECILCRSGNSIPLEEAILWPDEKLIEEDILEDVIKKIIILCRKIKECLKNILAKPPRHIKIFCNKLKNNRVVLALIRRFDIESKINKDLFSDSFKIEDITGDEIFIKSFKTNEYFCEYTKLSYTEASLTNVSELLEILTKWERGYKGKIEIMSRGGHILSKGVCMAKCILLMERINKLEKTTIDPIDELCNIDGVVKINRKNITSKFLKIGNEITSNTSILNSYDNIYENENILFRNLNIIIRNIKSLFSKKKFWMKSLLWLILIIMTAMALEDMMQKSIIPILNSIFIETSINPSFGTFKVLCNNKSFIITLNKK